MSRAASFVKLRSKSLLYLGRKGLLRVSAHNAFHETPFSTVAVQAPGTFSHPCLRNVTGAADKRSIREKSLALQKGTRVMLQHHGNALCCRKLLYDVEYCERMERCALAPF